ncbi:MAG TPA: glutamine amidotransferase [Rhizomicrobium sp.]|nr:glutamine amidotransferase [Rhizomicrobium sp.]
MTKTVLALRHVTFEDLGAFEATLLDGGYAVQYADLGLDDLSSFDTPDLLAVLGGPIGAYESDIYPFLDDEIALIGRRLQAGLPTLGICLGAQLMAGALGARVYPGRGKEIGWKALTLTPAGRAVLAPLDGLPVLHWHGDTFDLPPGAINLAATDLCDHQAFAIGRHALAFQFHPEAQQKGFERWLIGHAAEISATAGVSVPGLRIATDRYAKAAAAAGKACLRNWLSKLG